MKKVLIKIREELEKPEPKLDYIRGMVEVLIGEEEVAPAVKIPEIKVLPQKDGTVMVHGDPYAALDAVLNNPNA